MEVIGMDSLCFVTLPITFDAVSIILSSGQGPHLWHTHQLPLQESCLDEMKNPKVNYSKWKVDDVDTGRLISNQFQVNPNFVSQRRLKATLVRHGQLASPPCTQRTRLSADHLLHPSIDSPQRYLSVSSVLFTEIMYRKLAGLERRKGAKSEFSKLNANLHILNVLCKL